MTPAQTEEKIREILETELYESPMGNVGGINEAASKIAHLFSSSNKELCAALETISKYGKDGICPYGCDTPNIAHQALTAWRGSR